MSDELATLKKQVEELQSLVKRQSLLISKTGQSVLEMQVSKQKKDIADFDDNYLPAGSNNNNAGTLDTTGFATNEDLVQLVGELQGQLDSMEERSVRRVTNSTKTESKDFLTPLPNADGEIPDPKNGLFPLTLGHFEKLEDIKLYKLAKFYELLAPSIKEQEKFEEFLEGKVGDFHISETPDDDIEKELKSLSKEELDDIFNDVARYLGIRVRRGTDIC
ncbi:Mrp8p Ecym_8253 [Eremothecium cymbalariae DBVPG|uniref:Mrp8p n=1 Tax=Eremothecium cymbalariae (strain CBS 270.75 / DBVPG 7215 / KCTC 17166 / NRRL Y-17582) TaxID=931890 RepID=G8JXG2_ERECY|nr:Hypothetical protein Ecym_8253 [Eremothecium cymbalariae DBVPG\